MEASFIGRIEIYDEFSTVDLAAGMPTELLQVLQQVRVSGRPLNLSRMENAPVLPDRVAGKKAKFNANPKARGKFKSKRFAATS